LTVGDAGDVRVGGELTRDTDLNSPRVDFASHSDA